MSTVNGLQQGEWLLNKRYIKYDRPRDNDSQFFIGTDGKSSWMSNGLVEDWTISSRQHATEKKVTRTEMAKALHNAKNSPFTVTFKKLNGDIRALVGYMINADEMMGRARVIDLNINEQRLVDYRTLESLVLDGVKYTLKK